MSLFSPPKNIVVLGGGAIGLALLQDLLLNNGPIANLRCVGTWYKNEPVWHHDHLRWVRLDATNAAEMQRFREDLKITLGDIHWVINTVGFLHAVETAEPLSARPSTPEKRIADFNNAYFMHCMAINVTPTMLAAQYLVPLLSKTLPTVFAAVSAKVRSIEDNHLGGWYSYRASKAALNMALKTLSVELRHSRKNCCVAALHPGTTASPLSQPFSANVPPQKLFTPQYAAECMLKNINRLHPRVTGQFWNWDGNILPW